MTRLRGGWRRHAEVDDNTIIMADIAAKAIRQVKVTVVELMSGRTTPERAEELATALATGTWTHDYPISVEEAQALGLPVGMNVPKDVYRLMALDPQAAQRRPSVEYVPTPYGPRDERARRPRPERAQAPRAE